MAVFRPRRGKKTTAILNNIVLKRGEIFFEVPETGVGTGGGRIKMGDGATAYQDLPYYSDNSSSDISSSIVEFNEAPDDIPEVLLEKVVSGNGLNTIIGASKRLLRKYNTMIKNKVSSVNETFPDENGNIVLNRVPLSDNIYSPDNEEIYDSFKIRTSGGSKDISTGEAELSYIRGNKKIVGRIEASFDISSSSSHIPTPQESYVPISATIDKEVWKASDLGENSDIYTFTFDGSEWGYTTESQTEPITIALSTVGITAYGDIYENDTIIVIYEAENRGNIHIPKPVSFVSTGLNWFDKNGNMTLANYTIDSSGNIIPSSNSNVVFIKNSYKEAANFVIYDTNSSIVRIGWTSKNPLGTDKTGVTLSGLGIINNSSLSYITPIESGYIVVACGNSTDGICIHPSWSGLNDNVYEDYIEEEILLPMTDIHNNDLPLKTYGIPSIGSVSDVLSFDLKIYTQNVGRYQYSAENLALVKEMGVEYDYDSTNIFYVLDTPVVYTLNSSLSGTYMVNDYGCEAFYIDNDYPRILDTVEIFADNLYGQNLRDKLRRNVVTISPMTGPDALTDLQKSTVRSNIDASALSDLEDIGINLWDEQWEYGILSYGDFIPASEEIKSAFASTNFIPVIGGNKYYLTYLNPGNNTVYVDEYDRNFNFIIEREIINTEFLLDSSTTYLKFFISSSSGFSISYNNDICLNASNNAINGNYFPFKGIRKTSEFNKTSIHELKILGWVAPNILTNRNYIDYKAGILYQRIGRTKIGSLDWSMKSPGIFHTNPTRKYGSENFNVACSKYTTYLKSNSTADNIDSLVTENGNGLYVNFFSDTFYIADSSYSTLSSFVTDNKDLYIYYELREAIEWSLDTEALLTTDEKTIANPTLSGGEADLTSIQIANRKYKINIPSVPTFTLDGTTLTITTDSTEE